mmetsp:Transcript_133786/g.303457  ORF Transcript_133786/g.303457 Transcript_133786/m.303457 type:complete len:86 (-) Transcript_133786:252-509(-)
MPSKLPGVQHASAQYAAPCCGNQRIPATAPFSAERVNVAEVDLAIGLEAASALTTGPDVWRFTTPAAENCLFNVRIGCLRGSIPG